MGRCDKICRVFPRRLLNIPIAMGLDDCWCSLNDPAMQSCIDALVALTRPSQSKLSVPQVASRH